MNTGAQRRYCINDVEYTREALIHKYLHLVKYVAGKISVGLPPNVEINDLINDGIVGLIDAIEKYDDSRGVKFETYAITRINGSIIDALRALDWVPRAVRQRARALERAFAQLEGELGRVPSDAEVADRLGISLEEHAELLKRVRGTSLISLEEPLPTEKGSAIPLADTLRDPGIDIGAGVEQGETRRALTEAVNELPMQERVVITLYYFQGKALKDIKDQLNVSESRVSQIHSQAVIHLRLLLKQLQTDLGLAREQGRKRKYVRKAGPGAA